jgi:hypothetical protein
MVRIKSIEEIAKKWADVTPGRSTFYKQGVEDSAVDWEGPTAASEPAYEQGVQQAIAQKRYGSGVRSAGTAKWRKKSSDVGAERFGPGVRAAKDDMKSGFAPYHAVIERTSLPERGPRGDPANIARVQAISEALFAERTQG